jgi:hypothetical protein
MESPGQRRVRAGAEKTLTDAVCGCTFTSLLFGFAGAYNRRLHAHNTKMVFFPKSLQRSLDE